MKYLALSFLFFMVFNLFGEPLHFYRYGKKISLSNNLKEVALTGKIFVKFKETICEKEEEKLFKKYGVEEVKRFHYLKNWVLVKTPLHPVKTAALMVENGDFSAAEPSFALKFDKFSFTEPNDPYLSNQWYLGSTTVDHAHIISAWQALFEMGKTPGEGISVAVIDDGFDIHHEDLSGRFINWKDLGSNSKTDIYNPSIDKHGTACAGIIGAAVDNGKGIAGVCHSCDLIGVRYNPFHQIDYMAITAIDEAMKMGADVISCSWGVPKSEPAGNASFGQPVQELLKNIYNEGRNGKGTVVIFAAGNDDYDFSINNGFAANRHVLAVGASDQSGIRSNYSNYGNYLDIVAPSTKGINAFNDGIWTTDNYFFEQGQDTSGYNRYNLNNGDNEGKYYNGFSGTSASAPIVAGVAALILSANPELTAREVMNLIKNSADKIGPGGAYDLNGFSTHYGYGRINGGKAVRNASDKEFLKDPDRSGDDPSPDEDGPSDNDADTDDKEKEDKDNESPENPDTSNETGDEDKNDNENPAQEKEDSYEEEEKAPEHDKQQSTLQDEKVGCSIIFLD